MKKLLRVLSAAIIILFPLEMSGQGEIIIKGRVTDNSGSPVFDANVSIVNDSYGSATDRNGDYTIKLPAGYAGLGVVLEVRYIGFISQSKEIKIAAGTQTYNFQLAKDVYLLKPVVVSAQRREENLETVPISITAMDNREMRNRGIDQVFDLQNSIPNFIMGDGAYNYLVYSSIRGIAGATRAPGVEKRANYYLDDVYMGRSIAVDIDLFDVERLEILKGPQGTLFGKNTVSGAINITTRKPLNIWEATVSVDAGNLKYLNGSLILNAPLVDNKLFARFSGRIMRRDGFVTNLYYNTDMNGLNILTGRFQIRYLPSPNFDINLSFSALRDHVDNKTFGIALDGYGYEVAPGPREVSHDLHEYENRDIFGTALNMEYKFSNNYRIKSITAYRKIKHEDKPDIDFSPLPIFTSLSRTEDEHFTQEFRLTSPSYENYNFVTGIYYFYQKSDQLFGAEGSPESFPPDFILLSEGPVTINSIAGYFHSNINLKKDLSLFGGLRYTYEYKKISWSQFCEPWLFINIPNYTDTYSKGIFSPQIGIRYNILDQFMSYGKITWGYKSGGWGNHSVTSLEYLKLDPEYAVSYEIGFKLSTFKERLSFNSAVFYSNIDDYQAEVFKTTTRESVVPTYTNAAKAVSKGFELELITAPVKNLSLYGSFGYVDAVYDDFESDRDDYTGNKMEFAPETEYNFSIEYKVPVTNLGTFSIRGDYIHKDDYYYDASNSEDVHIASYYLIDGKIGFESSGGSFGIFLWGKNLSDNLYMLTRTQVPEPIKYAWYGIPRTLGIQVYYSFIGY